MQSNFEHLIPIIKILDFNSFHVFILLQFFKVYEVIDHYFIELQIYNELIDNYRFRPCSKNLAIE